MPPVPFKDKLCISMTDERTQSQQGNMIQDGLPSYYSIILSFHYPRHRPLVPLTSISPSSSPYDVVRWWISLRSAAANGIEAVIKQKQLIYTLRWFPVRCAHQW